MNISQRVLISPLDWGLGHAARCIPIINYLIKNNNEVVIAGSGVSGTWLKQKFPALEFFETHSPKVKYGTYSPILKVGSQIPKLIKSVKKENLEALEISKKIEPDLIISDNRYGFYVDGIKSVIISHQLKPRFPILNGLFIRKIEDWLLNFDEIWVPDHPEINLSGKLSSTSIRTESKTKFIGFLSHFSEFSEPIEKDDFNGFLVLLSGPENQRSKLHKVIIDSPYFSPKKLKVFGNNFNFSKSKNHIEYGVVTAKELVNSFNPQNIVIARSGYSSIMDLAYLGAKAIYVPTPGMSEQIYLAKHLSKNFNQIYLKQPAFKKEKPDIFKNIRPLQIQKQYFELFKQFV